MKDFSFGVVPVFKEGDKLLFLLIQHLHEKGGHWAFPKGHPEVGETEIESAKRELEEETGVKDVKIIEGLEFFEKYSFEQDGIHIDKTVKYFVGIANSKDVTKQEIEVGDYVWLEFEDALEKITFVEGKKMLKKVGENIDKINSL
ncbi:MAG: NUDIX domain-containing protein [Candidatus Magasanikbacteria bacterium]|nr:NUDIX domain-containing protein [Candidatus Magasanikbacteria bacterium]